MRNIFTPRITKLPIPVILGLDPRTQMLKNLDSRFPRVNESRVEVMKVAKPLFSLHF